MFLQATWVLTELIWYHRWEKLGSMPTNEKTQICRLNRFIASILTFQFYYSQLILVPHLLLCRKVLLVSVPTLCVV